MRSAISVSAALVLTGCGRIAFDTRDDAGGDSSGNGDTQGVTPDVTSGLVAWWKLDDTGAMALDSIGTAHGTATNVTWIAQGVIGGAAMFDGVSSTIDMGAARIDLPGPMTSCAWVSSIDVPNTIDSMVIRSCNPTSCQWSLEVELIFEVGFYWNNSGLCRALSNPDALAPVTWQHVCGTRVSDVEAHLYVDGAEIISDFSGCAPSATPAPISIGSNGLGGSYFHGMIDDVRLYDRALSATEVAAVHAHALGL